MVDTTEPMLVAAHEMLGGMSFIEHWERGTETDADVFELLRARRSSLLEEMRGTSASLMAQ